MLNVLFAGSPACSVPSLESVARRHRVVAVLTNPPAPVGRSREPVATPVALAAERLRAEGLIPADSPTLIPTKITDEVRAAIAARNPDAMACFAYGKIFGPKTLALFPRGALNVHPSLLPRWRGPSPVPAAILARDPKTGVSVQRMALEMDAGDILAREVIPLDGTETAESLLERAAEIGARLLADCLDLVEAGRDAGEPQRHEDATYCGVLAKEDGEIDWSLPAPEIDARIRAYHPWPGAFTRSGDSVLMILGARPYAGTPPASGAVNDGAVAPPGTVLGSDKGAGILVQTGSGVLALTRLQWRTKQPLDWKSFLNGTRSFVGTALGPYNPTRQGQ